MSPLSKPLPIFIHIIFNTFLRRKILLLIDSELKQHLLNQMSSSPSFSPLTNEEKRLIQRIREETRYHNVNNIKRTEAYLTFYLKHPEIHWSLLAHLVSRNAGWNMTDLQGEFLPSLLKDKERTSFFSFLERGNWLIFHDAFPQLLLYEQSKKQKKNLFHLLPHFHVSSFMEVMWNDFWTHHNHKRLTIALIVNEQNFIERRLVHHVSSITSTLPFKMYDFLSFNHILFPYTITNGRPRLVGTTVQMFHSLLKRIELGKRLYLILRNDPSRMEQIVSWARTHPHTGSRADYWPDVFHPIKLEIKDYTFQEKIQGCQLKKGALPIYSPPLQTVWSNTTHTLEDLSDWFKSLSVLSYFSLDETPSASIQKEYCETLHTIQFAVKAKKWIIP